MAKARRSKGRRRSAPAENAKAPQLAAAGPSEGRGSMLLAFSSLIKALTVLIGVLIQLKALIEALQSFNS